MSPRARVALAGVFIAGAAGYFIYTGVANSGGPPGGIVSAWYIPADKGGPAVAVHFRSVYRGESRTSLTDTLQTWNVETGLMEGELELAVTRNNKDHQVHKGAAVDKTWSTHHKEGPKLLDLRNPKVLADKAAVLAASSDYGGDLELSRRVGHAYHKAKNAVSVRGKNGKEFWVLPDLSTEPYTGRADVRIPKPTPCHKAWEKARVGKHLIKPEFRACVSGHDKARAVIQHDETAMGKDIVRLVSGIDEDGNPLWTFRVGELIGRENAYVPEATMDGAEVLVMVSYGGRTLDLFWLDPGTGTQSKKKKLF